LNLRPPGPQPGALPDCATPRVRSSVYAKVPSSHAANMCSAMSAPNSLRKCGRCGEVKPVDEFAWRRKARGQLDNYCRPCRTAYRRQHYLANRRRYIALAQERKRAVAMARATHLIQFFREHPCVDCGERDPVVLEFDHLSEKLFTIGHDLRDRSWESILAEIAKCDVVCANCHRRRTAQRRGSVRAALAGL
jgi:hypothetical protein